ncbi:DUF5106 domain-containing protein [Sphingobacteriales bacterium UPWRP_1]|nr:hypothetical protein BVG80_08010 [Sphingobacteriales bacterium TSM_CSM]PSJ78428.1 DUF5106 domain-containing protein [Sphingobacteriales bacterium UPWRP_1]
MQLNKFFLRILLIYGACLFLFVVPGFAKEGYNIKVKVKGFADTTCYLAYYYGSRILVSDTFNIDSKGVVQFKGNEKLPGGIYLAVFPGSKYFEMLVNTDNQEFALETDSADFVNNMKVTGSPDNKLFNDYQRYLGKKQKVIAELKKQKDTTQNEDSIALIDESIGAVEKDIKAYRETITKENPNSFLAAIIQAMWEPEIPEIPKNEKGDPADPQFAYKYFKSHYWDKYNFADGRLVRTPIFNNKITYYLDNLTLKLPDSINVSADFIIERAKANPDAFRFALSQMTYNYETSKIMGMDAVFVHLAQKYYLTGFATWMDSTNMSKMTERVNRLKYNLVGLKAPELLMPDLDNNNVSLHGLKSEYVVMVFWDYNCGHCKKEMPDIVALHEKYKDKGVTILGICTRVELDEIKKFVAEYKLPWNNLWDPYNRTKFRDLYDIYSTPTIYVLDKDKKIIAKRLDPKQVDEMLDNLINKKQAPAMKVGDDR